MVKERERERSEIFVSSFFSRYEKKKMKERRERNFLSLTNVVEPGAHRAVVREKPVIVVRFWPAHVHVLERGAVVGLLEQGVRPDAVGRLEAPHVGDRERRDLDVHAPDVAAGRGADLGDDAEGLEVGGEKERERER